MVKDIVTVTELSSAQLPPLAFSQGYNVLPARAVHKLFDTQLADKGLSHAGIWVESFLLGHLPSHSPSYAAVYWKRRKKVALILMPRYTYSLLKRLTGAGYLSRPQHHWWPKLNSPVETSTYHHLR